MNFALFPELKARGEPDALAVADHRLRLTWSQLDQRAAQLANVLASHGVEPAQRMAIYLPNRAEAVIALLACMKAGVVAVPLNWRLAGDELTRVLEHCAPAALLTTADRADQLPTGRDEKLRLTVGEAPQDGSFWQQVAQASPRFATRPCQAADVAALLYTSGTTSAPKAAIHTHGMRVAVAAAMSDCFVLSARDVALAVSPLFHTSGMSVFANAMFVGCPLILLEKWNLDHFIRVVAEERVTFLHLIGTLLVDLATAPEEHFAPLRGGSSVRFTWGGGHAIAADRYACYERRVGGTFLLGYSRTEGGLAYNPLDRALRTFTDHGLPNRNSSDVAVLDPLTQLRCAPGVVGEICVRGDGVSPGYWDGSFVRTVPPYDGGWQPTGDRGLFDAQGRLHFLGREDHMIKTGGENVFPGEVLAVLLAQGGVADGVVVGVPDERMGERVGALLVPGSPAPAADALVRACRSEMAGYKIPRVIAFRPELPRLGSGKVDLAACRQILLQQA